ncbi:MAG: Ig domain-containing protein, partial [Clostridia bacterium]|nr:Ig domain-containing protein [Clostridia bacterium]
MRKSSKLLAILLAVLMVVSVFPVSVFAVGGEITAVDIVTETVFPTGMVTSEPTFYSTIPVKMGDAEEYTNLEGVTWTRQQEGDWDGVTVGNTYTYKPALPDGYTWAEGVEPTITVKIVDATVGANSTGARKGFLSSQATTLVPYVVKANRAAYDATGCVLLVADIGKYPSAGHVTTATDATPTEGTTSITVTDNVTLTEVYGGGHPVHHVGDTYVYINNATVSKVYGGGRSGNVTGDAYIDLTGKVNITNLRGGSYLGDTTLSGTAYVTIHDLAEGSTFKDIGRGTASKLVVNLDDSSKHFVSAVLADDATEIYINGQLYVGVIDEATVTDIPASIIAGTASEVLPTTFGELEGFTWKGDDTSAGDAVFTLTAPDGYFFEGLVKTKEYTISVTSGVVEATDVTLDKVTADIRVGETVTLTATVSPDNVTDPTVTWTASENVELVETGATVTVKGVATGEATVTATAGNVSATCVVTVNPEAVITVVHPEVFNTVFPIGTVEAPVFYDELSVVTDGVETKLSGFTWTSADYNGAVAGEYMFTAVAPASYVFAEDATPVIIVEVVEATLANASGNIGFAPTVAPTPVPYVVKGVGGKNVAYDVTGFNALDTARGTAAKYFGGSHKSASGAVATEGTTDVTITDNASIEGVYGGGYGGTMTHTGNVNITIRNATVTSVFSGGLGSGATVNANAYVDISGLVDIGTIYASGSNSSKLNGTTTIDIEQIDAASTIDAIKRVTAGTNAADTLIVNLDDTSAHLIDKVENWKTDENIKVYINGILQVPAVESVELDQTEVTLKEGGAGVQLTATVAPDKADQTVVWTVEGDAVTVENGLVTPVKAGTATVTATAGDVSASCVVTVNAVVAYAGGIGYETFAEAVAAGGQVVLLADAAGDGIVIDKDVTIDLGGYTYTINGALVGSAGTETIGFQILKDNHVMIKNGAIAADVAAIEANETNIANGNKTLKMLIQNYADLSLENVTLDMSAVSAMKYVVSNNSGMTTISGETNITAPAGAVAFDVYDYSAAGYAVPTVHVDVSGTITGAIEVSETATLGVVAGTFTVDVADYCAEGFTTSYDEATGTYTVVEMPAEPVYADYTAVEEALEKVPEDLTLYTDETAQAVTDAVEAVVYDLPAEQQETVNAYAAA